MFALRRVVLVASRKGGFHRTKARAPAGAPSSSMTTGVTPASRWRCSPGLAMVAEQAMICGAAP
jgi:hypothetical protein